MMDRDRVALTADDGRDSEVSLFEFVTPLVRRWRLVIATPLIGAAVAAIIVLLLPATYTARTTVVPETSPSGGLAGELGGLMGLAGQLGLAGAAGTSLSPDFFVEVLDSRALLTETLRTEFAPAESDSASQPLLDLLEISGDSPAERLERGVRELRDRTDASVDRGTGTVTLAVDMHDPDLAAGVANRMIDLLNYFNLERRQFQSREQRRFTEERLTQARAELREAERAHLAFLQRNRSYTESPVLRFEEARLAREVQVRQEVYLSLAKAYEEARIAEVRDTPVLTIVDSAVAPVQRSSPKRKAGVFIGFLIAGVIGVGAAYVAEYRRTEASLRRPGYREFQDATQRAKAEIVQGVRFWKS